MDNATYDEVDLTPISTDETYSRLRATETKSKPSFELKKTEDIDHRAPKRVKQTNATESANTVKFNTVMLILMVILLLITLVSIALSVITFNRLASEQSKVLSQLEYTKNDIRSALDSQLDTTQMNLTQKILELVIAQSNISQNLNQLNTKLEYLISGPLLTQYLRVSAQVHCGRGQWHQLVYLNMSDPSQQCPPVWREYNTRGVRVCGRPTTSTGSCATKRYLVSNQYSQVCGRVIGYQYRTPDAFLQYANTEIEFDGINITTGAQGNHIWSYVAGQHQLNCPGVSNNAASPPQSVGDNYYCDSSDNDPLWDGQRCEGTCCTGTNSPPWFKVQLPAPTTDAIEVSICCDQGTDDEDVPITLIEIFVQ
jgi:dynein heavy chain